MTAKTKTILTFFGGLLTGAVLTILVLGLIGMARGKNAATDHLSLVEHPTQAIPYTEFEIIQVLPDGTALAQAWEPSVFTSETVLLWPQEGVVYYDGLKLDADKKRPALLGGTYSYVNKMGHESTVPIVIFQ